MHYNPEIAMDGQKNQDNVRQHSFRTTLGKKNLPLYVLKMN